MERFWKAEDPYFPKIKFASTKFTLLMPFWNQNGNSQQKLTFCQKIQVYRFGSKKTQISKILLEMENITSQLSKSGSECLYDVYINFFTVLKFPPEAPKSPKNAENAIFEQNR